MIEQLTKLLLEYQGKQGMTDAQLASLLDISASLISYLRSGKRHLGIDTVRAIWREIPELRNECWFWKFPVPSLAQQKQLADLKAMR